VDETNGAAGEATQPVFGDVDQLAAQGDAFVDAEVETEREVVPVDSAVEVQVAGVVGAGVPDVEIGLGVQ
jgi:hypothetical protein